MKDLKQIQEFFSKPLEEVTKSQMLKKAKKGSYPATLVAIENGKVVAQEKVSTPQEAPAAHSVMSKKYPNANIRLEDSTGKILEEISKEDAWKKFQKEKSVTDKTIKAARKDFEKEWEAGKLNEGKQLDIEDFAKVVQAVTKTGHPVTVLLTPKFNEIEIITGMNAPDDMLFDLSNAVDSLGYDVIIAADSSNLSRREYSQIRRVNGGHKDYFEESVNEERKLTYNDFVRMVRDDMMAGAAPDERPSDKQVASRAKAYYNDYLQGASLDDLFEATKEEENEFHKKLDKLVHKTFGHSSDEKKKMDESSTSEERRIAKRAIRSIAKYRGVSEDEARNDLIRAAKELGDLKEEEGYSKFLKDDPEHPGGKTKGLTPDVMNKILMNVIKDLDELKQLGEGVIEEELCDKGKRYIKARQAAGEKSSAYLSGRAVRVCKGQIEWPKKGKKKK